MSDPTLNYYDARGTTAERTAFTPSPATPAAGPLLGYLWWDTDDQVLYAYDFGLADWVATGGGGSGDVTATGTLTADTVMLGDGTTAITSLPNGSDGEVLTLTAGVPSWEAASGGGDFALIEQKTPTSVGTVTFSSLGAFTHLELRWTARSTQSAAATSLQVRFNADTGGNYDTQQISGTAAAATAAEAIAGTAGFVGAMAGATATAGLSGAGLIKINNYRGTAFQKTWIAECTYRTGTGSGSAVALVSNGGWRNTAAITSLTVLLTANDYDTGSTLTLYGLT